MIYLPVYIFGILNDSVNLIKTWLFCYNVDNQGSITFLETTDMYVAKYLLLKGLADDRSQIFPSPFLYKIYLNCKNTKKT